MSLLRPATSAALLSGLFLLAACGGATPAYEGKPSASTAPAPSEATPLRISTASLPAGHPGIEYPATSLLATPAADATWDLASGSLPPGMALSSDGLLSGCPEAEGVFEFTVRAETATAVATRTFTLPVGTFTVEAQGLVLGRAWTETPVTLVARGASGSVTYAVTENASGGRFLATSPGAGSASWAPGTDGEPGAIDRFLATDASGATSVVTLSVMPHPAAQQVAEFGTTDVWYVDMSRKLGDHAYATDVHEALVRVGLRAPGSRDVTGTLADQLAEYLVRRLVLRNLNLHFLREESGEAGALGLPISFPMDRPAGYDLAAAGSWLSGGSRRYSAIGVHAGSTKGVMGLAFLDDARNEVHENNTTNGATELGVFVDQFLATFLYAYEDPRVDGVPLSGADVPALEALLYGLPSPGGRYDALEARVRGFAKTIADTCAHEIGHSIGLPHTSPRVGGSLMNTTLFLGPNFRHAFLPEDIVRLRGALPGLGRTGGLSKPAGLPAGGVEASLCVLRVEVPGSRPLPAWAVRVP